MMLGLSNLAGRTEKYGPLNWRITARVLTKRYNKYGYDINFNLFGYKLDLNWIKRSYRAKQKQYSSTCSLKKCKITRMEVGYSLSILISWQAVEKS